MFTGLSQFWLFYIFQCLKLVKLHGLIWSSWFSQFHDPILFFKDWCSLSVFKVGQVAGSYSVILIRAIARSPTNEFCFSRITADFLDVSKSRKLERTWSFDSNRELVERDLSHSEDEEEKGSLQVACWGLMVQTCNMDYYIIMAHK